MDTFLWMHAELESWSKSARSSCIICKVSDLAGIARALAFARSRRLSVIPRGAGHSYTDAALNTAGVVIDVTPMRRILSWDPASGIMCAEPGVTMHNVVKIASRDGWWPFVSPSSSDITIGGCAAMNVNGRNAWKCGPFGEHILSLNVLLSTGEVLTLVPERDDQLFLAFIGSMGLLGIITSITFQLQHVASGSISLRRRNSDSLDEIFSVFAEEENTSDFMEAWLDGFAGGHRLGRGYITCATFNNFGIAPSSQIPQAGVLGRMELPLVKFAGWLGRPLLVPVVQMANRASYGVNKLRGITMGRQQALYPYTFWPSAAIAGYHAVFPEGVETFHAFVPVEHAKEVFDQVMRYSHHQECLPVWCIIKQHRRDLFLLSYQVDGFSLELNYQRTRQGAQKLEQVLKYMIAIVIDAGGRFYPAKDHFLTHAQYRQSIGDEAVNAFLSLKKRYDPEMVFQSDLLRRVFQPQPI